MIIDIHSHILPGVDDGASCLEDSLIMARQALDSGVSAMVATPHYNCLGCTDMTHLKDAYLELCDALEYEQLPLRLKLGMEILASDDLPQLLQQGKVWTYPGSDRFLVEFIPNRAPEYMNDLLASCKAAGFTPVIAHPERYEAVREDPYIVKNWQELGYGIQVNRDSLMGVFGHRTAQCAMYLLHRRWAGCIASDAHSPHGRNADWRPAFDLFWEHFELPFIDRCLQTRPKEILNLKH